jgi:outer membrane protein assembly factor BamB
VEGGAVPPAGVIELDLSAPWEPPERPRPRRPLQRVLAFAAALAVVLALFTASRHDTGYGAHFTIDGSGYVDMRADAHTLYVLRQVNLDTSIIDAYRMSDGHRAWSQRRSRVTMFIDITRGVLLIHVPASGSLSEDASVIVALDAGNGHEVWRRPDYSPAFFGTGSVLSVLTVDPYVPGSSEDQNQLERRSHRLDALDVQTGATVWSHVTPAGTLRSFLTQPEGSIDEGNYGVGELDPDGSVRVLDLQTGRVVRTAHVPNVGPVGGFDISGDLMMTYQSGQNGPQGVSVFDLATGQRLWGQPPSEQPVPMWWCGPVMCSDTDTTSAVVEPRTGRTLWQTAPGFHATPLDDTHMITFGASTLTAGDWPTVVNVQDLRTGAVLRQLGGWQVVGLRTWPVLVVLGRDGSAGGLVGVVDADTGHTTVIGRMGRLYADPTCQLMVDLFVCRSGVDLDAFRIPA